jgi:tetratricopeptide (TPR) repeat protein
VWVHRTGPDDRGRSDENLERQHDELTGRAREAASRGDYAGQVRLYGEAIGVCRELVKRHPDDQRHLAQLAADLYNYAYYLLRAAGTLGVAETLAESLQLYSRLVLTGQSQYEVAVCDVRLRMALAQLRDNQFGAAVVTARDVLDGYQAITGGDQLERDFGIVRTHALIGRALLLGGRADEAMAEFDQALFAAERLREATGVPGTDFSWLAGVPGSFRQAAPEWLGAAVAAMELHYAAGDWDIAADACNVAMRVAGGLAGIGDERDARRFESLVKRSQEVWWAQQHPVEAAAKRAGPTGRVVVGAGIPGPSVAPDIAAISLLAGWGLQPS